MHEGKETKWDVSLPHCIAWRQFPCDGTEKRNPNEAQNSHWNGKDKDWSSFSSFSIECSEQSTGEESAGGRKTDRQPD